MGARRQARALVLACGVMLGLANVVGGQTHGVWLTVLTAWRGLSPPFLLLAPTLFYLAAALAGGLVGWAIDRAHTRRVVAMGTAALAGGTLCLGSATHLWQVSLGFIGLGIGFACLGPITLGKILAGWFQGLARRRAFALATLGPSLGGGLVWLFASVALSWGLLAASVLLAVLTASVLAPLLPVLGAPVPRPVSLAGAGMPSPWSRQAARRSGSWWALALAISCVMAAQTSYIIHAVPLYAETFGLRGASVLWTVSGFVGAGARLAYAWLPRPLGAVQMAGGVYLLEALSLGLLAARPPPALLLGAAALLGACVSLTVTLEPHVATDTLEHTGAYGVLYGRLYRWSRLAAAGGALGSGWLRSASGDYVLSLTVMSLLLTVAALAVRWVTPLGPVPPRGALPPA